ncbi:MAG: hypothetical protein NTU61_05670 [Candidatus Altiarchaeota archaeon]|nr:hypothetical protein [Candidatus Altiarchaeota archaeon]
MERKFVYATVFVLFLFLALGLSSNASAEIIIVNETKAQLYALENVRLSGDLDSNVLSMSGSGEVIVGDGVKIYLFGQASDILVDNVVIAGNQVPVSFDNKGYFFVANKGKFSFTGELKIRTPGQVRLYVQGPMNELTLDLLHGYAIGGDKYGLYGQEVILQRSEKVATLVDGSFRFTYAERNDFYYTITYRSFGKSLGREEVLLRIGESLVSVAGAKDYSVQNGVLVLELEGIYATVVASGTFNSNSLKVPLKEGTHHVLIESDPEKKISISTDAKEIDLSQATLPFTYSNARAFLASDKNYITVDVKQLDKYPSLAASVSSATNSIAITEKGSMLGELSYRYSNTGVDYIQIDAPGTPLYAATSYRDSVKLTKEDDKLFLSFPKTAAGGSGTLDMIYFDPRDALKPVDMVDVPVANTELPVTQQTTTIYLPSDYTVLYTFGAKGGSELPDLKTVVLFAIVIGGIAYGMKSKISFVVPYTLFMAGLLLFDGIVFGIALIISIVLVIKRYIEKKALTWMIAGAGVLVVLCFAVLIFFAVIWQLGVFNMGGSSYSEARIASDYATVNEAAMPMAKSMSLIGEGTGAINVPQREGVLPVRMELPNLGKTITVTNHLVTNENPVKLSILIVSNWLAWILYAVALAVGYLAHKQYRG